jgi:cytochrome c-type biogenesis protein CcmH/NrfG
MKTMIKLLPLVSGLVSIASSVCAQNIADAKKAIDAEQYQKAKTILKSITGTSAANDETCFYLGFVYIKQDYPDSAKTLFAKGIAINAKSALNYVGLAAVAKLNKQPADVKANLDKAIALAGKNDKPYIYTARVYLMQPAPDANAALAVLDKASTIGAKDPEYFTCLGDAYGAKQDNNHAYLSFSQAQDLDPKAANVDVAIGSLWKQADNFEDAAQKFKDALTLDPNYGPAYRELAENDLLWGKMQPKVMSEKIKEGAVYYKKYLDLTDRSVESEMRYADFLIQAGDYKTLEEVANDLSRSSKTNLRIYRYLAYAAFENKNYQAGLDALNKFMKEADPNRVIPRDYLYLGRLQIKTGLDSLGILNLKKAVELDSTHEEVYTEIANAYYAKEKYADAGQAYQTYIAKAHHVKLNDYFREGMSYYFAYSDEYYAPAGTVKVDTTLLTKADSAFSYVQQKTTAHPYADVFLYRARIKDLEDGDRTNLKGLAQPFYERYIELETATPPTEDRVKKNLGEAYAYLGSYFEYKEKDDAKAADSFAKARDIYPDNKQAKAYFANKQTMAKAK